MDPDLHVIVDEVEFVHAYALEHEANGPIEDLSRPARICSRTLRTIQHDGEAYDAYASSKTASVDPLG